MFSYVDTHNKKPLVIVVGAGLAGLAAANTLQSSGIVDVKLLEAQSEPGGRIKTVELDGGLVELGAQWLHSVDSTLYEYANEKQLLNPISWGESLGDFFRINGEKVSPQVVREVDLIVSGITSSCSSFYRSSAGAEVPKSFQEYLGREFEKYAENCGDSDDARKIKLELLDWHTRFQVIDNCCNRLDQLSAKFWGQYALTEQDHFCIKGGYSGIVRSLAESLEPGVLMTDCPVRQIQWAIPSRNMSESAELPCCVILENGKEVRGHHIIVTCSVGVLKARADFFDPTLPPSFRKGLEELGYDTVNKIFLLYKKPWWNDSTGFQLIWDFNEMAKRLEIPKEQPHWTHYLTGFDTVQEFPRALCGWIGGRGALEVEKLPENDISTQCTQMLRTFLGRRDIPMPVKVLRSQWASNKYIRGGYSHISTLADRSDSSPQTTLTNPLFDHTNQPRLLLAGEAIHPEHYSTAHGAFASGQNQASKLLTHLKRAPSS